MNFKEFFEANPAEVEKASKCKNLKEFKKLVDEAKIDYKDEEEVKSAYNFVKGENGELTDDMLEAASGGRAKVESQKEELMELDEKNILKGGDGKKYYRLHKSNK